MDERKEAIDFEEVLDNEVDDIWDIFFPYMSDKKERFNKIEVKSNEKPRRSLKFLTM